MDGSKIVIPSASLPAGLAREDALFRIVYYGEALRAMTEHVSDTLISGPCVPMIELLDESFDRMSESRDTFGPEEFTLFVMSKMLGMCDDDDEARQFQVGAAQYILKSADALPDHYKPVVDDARQMLRRTAALALSGTGVTSADEAAPPAMAEPVRTTAADATPDTEAQGEIPAEATSEILAYGNAPGDAAPRVMMTDRVPPAAAPATRSPAPRARIAGFATPAHPRHNMMRVRRGHRIFGAFEKLLGVAMVVLLVALYLLSATGALDDYGIRDVGGVGSVITTQ